MSADLFAEFNSTETANQQQQPAGTGQTRAQAAPAFSFFDDFTNSAPAPVAQQQPQQSSTDAHISNYGRNEVAPIEDNDDWGDFEGDSSSFEPAPPLKQDPFANSLQTSQPLQATWSTAPAQFDPFSSISTQIEQPSQEFQTAGQRAPVIKAKKSADPSVLFDAEDDFDDDDDFGDFEGDDSTALTSSTFAGSAAAADLLGDLNLSHPTPAPPNERSPVYTTRKAPSPSEKKGTSGAFGTVTKTKQTVANPAPSGIKEEESWDTFDDWEASIPTKAPAKAPIKPQEAKVAVDTGGTTSPPPILSPTLDDPRPGELPPTNVPPPAVLLTLFPPLFADAQNSLFKPMAAQPLPMRNKLLSEPATIIFLQGYLMLASVAGHIIAGRKLRWKRDQHLSQGMRIGPASSRATSGMKLSSIDKGENMKEEREASDVVRAWKDQIGRLRHVVSAANQIKADTLSVVPDIQETMPVKVLKQGEGGVPAPQPCMLCGLKRDERAGLADQGIEDSFGEWWVEQVNMHRGCRNFWNEHRDKLRQR